VDVLKIRLVSLDGKTHEFTYPSDFPAGVCLSDLLVATKYEDIRKLEIEVESGEDIELMVEVIELIESLL